MGTRQSIEMQLVSRKIDEQIQKDQKKSNSIVKLLLLGPGESGKSTVLKQMKILHGTGFNAREAHELAQLVYMNVLQSIVSILEAMVAFTISFDNLEREVDKEILLRFIETSGDHGPMTVMVSEVIKKLWSDAGVQRCFSISNQYQLSDSAKYFLDEVDRISSPGYVPTREDIVRIRVRTTGIVQVEFKIKGVDFRVFDVGGQRNERKKWIHCFDEVTSIVFVVAMSEYDQVLAEDNKTNRMLESMHLYDSICNSVWFSKTSIILFLNKKDIFAQKLHTSPLQNFFNDYHGSLMYDQAAEFMETKFGELNKCKERDVYIHQTCATDTNQIQLVLESCTDSIIKKRLNTLGLM